METQIFLKKESKKQLLQIFTSMHLHLNNNLNSKNLWHKMLRRNNFHTLSVKQHLPVQLRDLQIAQQQQEWLIKIHWLSHNGDKRVILCQQTNPLIKSVHLKKERAIQISVQFHLLNAVTQTIVNHSSMLLWVLCLSALLRSNWRHQTDNKLQCLHNNADKPYNSQQKKCNLKL